MENAKAETVNAKVVERDALLEKIVVRMRTGMEEAEKRIEQLVTRIQELEAEKAAGLWGEKAARAEGGQ
ncbi:MAG: hypothetical protein Q9179_004953, partial [Wetmoreana sp. 5 TL-2023]